MNFLWFRLTQKKPLKTSNLPWRKACIAIVLTTYFCFPSQAKPSGDTTIVQAERENVIFLTPQPFVFPWVTYDNEESYRGILYDSLAEAARRANVNLIVKPQPIKRTFISLLDGEGDFALLPFPLPKDLGEATAFYIHPKPVIHFNLALFKKRDNQIINTKLLETNTYRIGTQRLIGTRLEALMPQNHHDWITLHSIPALLKALETNRVELILTNENTTIAEAARLGIMDHLEIVQRLNGPGNYSVVWSNSSPTPAQSETTRNFIAALDGTTCDGTVDKIIERFWQTLEIQDIHLNTSANFSKAFSIFCPK